jgi:PST family polysaccharide transporter
LRIALVIAPLVITGYLIGLPYGPRGVALGYSVAMTLWVAPHIAWCVRGTGIAIRDVVEVLRRPVLSAIVAAVLIVALRFHDGQFLSPWLRIVLGSAVFVSAYLGMLLFAMGEKGFYQDLLRGLRSRSTTDEEPMA